MALRIGDTFFLPFEIPATELSAGTPIELVSPIDGFITEMQVIVQVAIVTGGAITVEIATVAVTGLSVTVADAAAKGVIYTDPATVGTTTRAVAKGARITVTPAAAFNGGGAVRGNLILAVADNSPQ